MSQNTAKHDRPARSGEEEAPYPQARQPEHQQHARPHRPVGQPAGDGPVSPDQPDETEFELIGDDDLSPADLGPAAPNATDPDLDSERLRKITR
jgi:hypothetical protein